MRLKDKVALVTGASRGIGRAIAMAFAVEGADVAVNYLQAEREAQEVAATIGGIGRRAIAVPADVSQGEAVTRMVAQVLEGLGRIDILVNNAGILLPFDLHEPDFDAWQRMVDVNIKGILLCSQAVASPMRQQGGGRIINVVIRETRGGLGYVLTKAAGETLTRGLARKLAPQILVNAIAPGCVDTGWISALSPEEQQALRERIPLQRWGQPQDVARVALFLASDDAGWMTGTTIPVDGGEM